MEKLIEILRRLCLLVNWCICAFVSVVVLTSVVSAETLENDIGFYIFMVCIFVLVSLVIHLLINWIFLKKSKEN